MKINKLSLDTQLTDQPPSTSPFLKNALITNKRGVIENEPGFQRFNNTVPYSSIGIIPIDTSFVVFSTDNADSEIGVIDSAGTYTQVYNDPELEFDTSAPVVGEYHRNFKGERIVAFITDINVPRIINIDDTSGISDINDLRLFPHADVPVATFNTNDSGGSLLTGAYQAVFKYRDRDGGETNWLTIHKPININDETTSEGLDSYDGAPAGTVTGKSITVNLTNVDTRFDNIVLGVISIIGGITTAVEVKEQTITSSTMSMIYTGGESSIISISLDEVLVNNASYINAKAITQLNNRLYLGNLSSEEEFDFQPYANEITVQWTSELVALTTLNIQNNKIGEAETGFMHGEVYALYIALIYNNGNYSRAFHIPGREPDAADLQATTLNDVGSLSTELSYQIEDTTKNISGSSGDMGAWINQNEVYPTNSSWDGSVTGPDLTGENVRHHRFPTIDTCKTQIYSGSSLYGKVTLDRLSIDVSNVNIPVALQAQVQGYQIFYAKRSPINSTVVGQSVFQFASCDEVELETANGGGSITTPDFDTSMTAAKRAGGFNYSGGNRDTESDNRLVIVRDNIRFGAFDMLTQKPAISPNYITNQLKYSIELVGDEFNDGALDDSGRYTHPEGGTADAGETDNRRNYLFNLTNDFTTAAMDQDSYARAVSNGRYIPANVIDEGDEVNNREGEETWLSELEGGDTLDLVIDYVDGLGTGGGTISGNIDIETYLSNLQQLKDDMYLSFDSQPLVATDKIQTNPATTTLSDIHGGDTVLSLYSLFLGGSVDGDTFIEDITSDPTVQVLYGRKQIVYFACEGYHNAGLRHQLPANNQSIYWPKTPNIYEIFYNIDTRENLEIQYNTDYSTKNELAGSDISIFDQNIEFANEFPHTLIRSAVAATEEENISWRTFLSNERFTMPRDKGEIINLQGIGNERLLIHQRDGLFITRDRTTIQGDITDATLGAADIFDLTPQEIIPTLTGYAGTQHRYSCVLTKIGYAFVDASQGKIFILNGTNLDEISNKATRNFFRDNLPSNLNDNPFNSTGYMIAYDETYNRLLVSVQNSSSSFTVSYSPELDGWISFHDYTPDFMFATKDNRLFSVVNDVSSTYNGVFRHHIGDYGVYLNSEEVSPTPYPLVIDIVFNDKNYQSKLFKSIEWITESVSGNVYDFNDTFDYITLSTNYKTTGRVELERLINMFSTTGNVRNSETSWFFNKIRNVNTGGGQIRRSFANDFTPDTSFINNNLDWYKKSKFVDKFVVCRLEYENLQNNKFYFLESFCTFKESFRS